MRQRISYKDIFGGVRNAQLNRIASHLKREDCHYIPPEYYGDILESQRFGVYPAKIRKKAWDLFLALLEAGRTEQIVETLLLWPPSETRLLFRQFLVFKLSKWTQHPATLSADLTLSQVQTSPPELDQRGSAWLSSMCIIINAMLRQSPRHIHEALNFQEYLLLHLPHSIYPEDLSSSALLCYFFDHLAHLYSEVPDKDELLPTFPEEFIEFLHTGPSDFISLVVDRITRQLQLYTSRETYEQPGDTSTEHLGAYSKNVHPSLPYLSFATFLSLRSDDAFERFQSAGILQILQDMWTEDSPGADPVQGTRVLSSIRIQCCKYFGVISIRKTYENGLANHLRSSIPHFFLDIYIDYLENLKEINSVRSPRYHQPRPDDRAEFVENLMILLLSKEIPPDLKDKAWSLFLHEMLSKPQYPIDNYIRTQPRAQVVQFLKNAIFLRTSSWKSPDGERISNKHLRRLLTEAYSRDPSILHENVATDFLAFVMTHDSGAVAYVAKSDWFSSFFDMLIASRYIRRRSSQLPENARFFLKYLKNGPRKCLYSVIRFILTTVKSISFSVNHRESVDMIKVSSQARALSPYLLFAIHLVFESEVAANCFFKGRLLEMIARDASAVVDMNLDSPSMVSANALLTQMLLLVGALAKHSTNQTVEILAMSQVSRWLLDTEIDALAIEFCISTTEGNWYDLTPSINEVMSLLIPKPLTKPLLFPIPDGPALTQEPWACLTSAFLARMNDVTDPVLHQSAAQVMLFCATTPEEDWTGLINIMSSNFSSVLSYILRHYLDCDERWENPNPPIPMLSTDVSQKLSRMCHRAKQLGLNPTNPVDRLVAFIREIAKVRPVRTMRSLSAIGIFTLLEASYRGNFDAIDSDFDGDFGETMVSTNEFRKDAYDQFLFWMSEYEIYGDD
ncbi:hypothetical protein C8Q75DRAFT_787487 [Abortiporus biennis]|nr:hypothetical protein C8Q75DRAFT_787487 [Abortiporus biennis]